MSNGSLDALVGIIPIAIAGGLAVKLTDRFLDTPKRSGRRGPRGRVLPKRKRRKSTKGMSPSQRRFANL